MSLVKLTLKEKEELEKLYKTHESEIMRVSLYELNDPFLAEDNRQNVMIKLASVFKERGDLGKSIDRSYIISMTRNTARDIFRHNKHEVIEDIYDSVEYCSDIDEDASKFAEKYGYSDEVVRALKKLNKRDKQIVYMKFKRGYSFVEISEYFGMNPNYASMRFGIIKKVLMEELERGRRNDDEE